MNEEEIADFEAELAHEMDVYFKARPQLMRSRDQECIYEAGFRMAWNVLLERINDTFSQD